MFSIKAMLIAIILVINIVQLNAFSSPLKPFSNYTYSVELQADLADLWWTVNNIRKEITFEFHVKTTGWIALGISPGGGMKGADIGLGWIDKNGRLHFEDRYATTTAQPSIDNTTADWIGLQGREENGWTAIQFKRPFDSCDSMDVRVGSGTNILIYAYSLDDPEIINGRTVIRYHEDRRYSKVIPLLSYANPPAESKFSGLDYIDFKLDNYEVPDSDTTYHCKIYKAPTISHEYRHAIGYKTLVDQPNYDIVHHILMYECNPDAIFDDENLPNGLCDDLIEKTFPCSANIANGWAVGADELYELPDNVGYPMGSDFEIKYYMIQMHYDNPRRMKNRLDSSGIRFYFSKERRQHELGYLSFGAESSVFGIVIPPKMNEFIIDSYCPAEATRRLPEEGITIISSFPHTHLQGRSLWTKLIRNGTAVQYLFNAEAYDFNYQFLNTLTEPIKIYPGDEFVTRCIYQTADKNQVTLGGESTKNEMCLHMFSYYPRMKNMYACFTQTPVTGWESIVNSSTASWSYNMTYRWASERNWNTENSAQWQEFQLKAPQLAYAGRSNDFDFIHLEKPLSYKDLVAEPCRK